MVPPGLPEGVVHARSTPSFTAEGMPAGLRRAHRLAPHVWGVLHVEAGSLDLVVEASGQRRRLGAGDALVIAPDWPHHVEPAADVRFRIELYRDDVSETDPG